MMQHRQGRNFILLTAAALFLSCTSFESRVSGAKRSERAQSWVERYVLADSDQVPDSYRYRVELAERQLAAGRYADAAEIFEVAMRERFVEAPNYEIAVRVAEAKCLSGHQGPGLRLLAEFDCMLDVELGRRKCFWYVDGNERPDRGLSALCFERMCSELYLRNYEEPTDQTRARVSNLRREALRVRKICVQTHLESRAHH